MTTDATAGTSPAAGLRVGMIGAGGIAHEHLPAWLALGAEVSIFSLAGADRLISDCGGGRSVGDLDALLASADVVDICTPTTQHADYVQRAADAGRHILCEKPLARTSDQTRQLIDITSRAGVQLYPGHVVRYFPAFAAMHEQVAAGAVGEVAVQRFSRIGSRPVQPWFHDPAASGGIVLDQMIHDIDFACWNAGAVDRVFARSRRTGTVESGVDSAQVILTHRSSAISYVTGVWARPGSTFRTTFEIAGSDGLLRHDSAEHPELRLDRGAASTDGVQAERIDGAADHPTDPAGTGLLPDLSGAESPFLTEIRELCLAFRGGPPPRVSAADGLRAVIIAEAANRSIETGRAVSIDETRPQPTASDPTEESPR